MNSYIGPTGLTVIDGKLHIEGYPDTSRVVQLTTQVGMQLADLRLHHSDLMFCERVIQYLGNALIKGPPDLSKALWISILTKFYSSFKRSKARSSLNSELIYSNNPEALSAFQFFEAVRDKHIVHDENNYNYSVTAAVLGSKSEVHDILSQSISHVSETAESCQTMYNLVDMASKYVGAEITKLLKQAFAEVHAMTPKQRELLPELVFRTYGAGDEVKTRKP